MSKKPIALIGIVLVLVVLVGGGWKYHEQPRFCGDLCHIMDPYLESWQGSDYGASAHAAEGVTCLDCHEPTIREQVKELVAYVKGDFTVPLEELEVSDEFCYDCHLLDEHENKEQVVERTAELERNPHNSPLIGEIGCGTCHKMHKPSEDQCAVCHDEVATGAGWTTEVTRTAEIQVWDAAMDCTVCKSMVPYAESLDGTNLLAYAHAEEGLVCLDCHEQEATKQVHEEAVPGKWIKPLKVEMQVCFDCHVENEHNSYAQVIARTTDYTMSTAVVDNEHASYVEILERTTDFVIEDRNINPHDPHADVEGMSEQYECHLCHQMHEESPLIDGCYSCHHSGSLASCSTIGCHEQ